jgi:hypothetical protein
MAAPRPKRTRPKNSKLSMRAVKSGDKILELSNPLTPFASSNSLTPSNNVQFSHSLPGSPISKFSPSLQPSPSLSTNSDFVQSDINPFLLPPLAFHSIERNAFSTSLDLDFVNSDLNNPTTQEKQSKETETVSVEECEARPMITGGVFQKEDPKSVETQSPEEVSTLEKTTSKIDQQSPIHASEPSSAPKPPTQFTDDSSTKQRPAQDVSGSQRSDQTTEIQHTFNALESNLSVESRLHLQPNPQHSGYYPALGFPYHRYFPPMSYSNGYPLGYSYGAPPPRNGSPYQTLYGNVPGPYPPPIQRHDSIGSRGSHQGDLGPGPSTGDNASAIEDDPGDLVDRISSVIPDIHMLLSRSKVTHGELGLREQLLRKVEAETKETVKQKEDHINQLHKQLHDSEKRYAKDVNKFRFQLANLDDKVKELNEQLAEFRVTEKENNEKIRELQDQKSNLLLEHMALRRAAAEEKKQMAKAMEGWTANTNEMLETEKKKTAEEQVRLLSEFKDWKASTKKIMETEKQMLAKQHENLLDEQEMDFEFRKAQLTKGSPKEKDGLLSNFQVQKEEFAAGFDKLRKELEVKLSKAQEDLEHAIKTQRESRNQWDAERDAITTGWEEERAKFNREANEQREVLTKQHEDDMALLTRKHKDDLNEQMMGFVSLQEGINKKMTAENEDLRQQIEFQTKQWDEERDALKRMVSGIQDVAQNLEAEKGRLEKLVQCFGEVTDVKSKGDAY